MVPVWMAAIILLPPRGTTGYSLGMGRSSKASTARLYEVASQQQGFFTTRQALAAGYADNVHSYHVHNGDWRRVIRGIYRLERYPETPHWELMLIWLWSQNRAGQAQAVFSHNTALFLLGQQSGLDGPVEITLPPHFQRKAQHLDLQRYTAVIPDQDRQQVGSFQVTTLERTLRDLNRSLSSSIAKADEDDGYGPDSIAFETQGGLIRT